MIVSENKSLFQISLREKLLLAERNTASTQNSKLKPGLIPDIICFKLT